MTKTFLRKWQSISTVDIVEDLPWLKLSVESVVLPSGKKIDRFYQIHLPEYAVIVAVTCEGFVVMENQYKHAVGEVILNLPAGYLQPDESPLTGARRELLEETGYEAKDWFELGSFWVDGNRGCGRVHSFVAVDARRLKEPQNEDTEELEVLLRKPVEILQLLLDGKIATVGSALTLSLAFLSPLSPLATQKIGEPNCKPCNQITSEIGLKFSVRRI